MPVIHSTFVIEREFGAAPERVFTAFADSAQRRRWFVETEGHQVEDFAMDFRVGGTERSQFHFRPGSPVAGMLCVTDSSFLEIVPGERVVSAGTMDIGGKRISASLVTVELAPGKSGGTAMVLTHQGAFFEGSDGPERRAGGWKKLVDRLSAELESGAR
jgi:uncharacterized protein YndB with AHSA1/START domain